jgi:hypothetical protein
MKVDPPAPIVPMPAATFAELRGRRVIVGVPGIGFRGDLRADDAVTHGSRTFVPILSEQDYYRAETDQLEVFAPLVPLDRVWVEHPQETPPPLSAAAGALDAPPRREALAAMLVDHLIGRRIVQSVPDGHVRDLRAVTDEYINTQGVTCARICAESDWYLWALTGTTPTTSEVDVKLLWVE